MQYDRLSSSNDIMTVTDPRHHPSSYFVSSTVSVRHSVSLIPSFYCSLDFSISRKTISKCHNVLSLPAIDTLTRRIQWHQ
jgi:hypothetical protein